MIVWVRMRPVVSVSKAVIIRYGTVTATRFSVMSARQIVLHVASVLQTTVRSLAGFPIVMIRVPIRVTMKSVRIRGNSVLPVLTTSIAPVQVVVSRLVYRRKPITVLKMVAIL